MDNILEGEPSKPERIISLGKEFHPFDPKHIKQLFSSNMGGEIKSPPILLDIGNGVFIPLNIAAYSTTLAKKIDSLTPFTPEDGYQIDDRDFDLRQRIDKIQKLEIEWGKSLDPSKTFLILEIKAHAKDLNTLGLNKEHEPIRGLQTYKFSKEILDIVSRLTVIVSFPQGRYEARPLELFLNKGEIDFRLFHPADSTRLATSPDPSDLNEGLHIVLPPNLDNLREMRVKFAVVEEQLDHKQQEEPQA